MFYCFSKTISDTHYKFLNKIDISKFSNITNEENHGKYNLNDVEKILYTLKVMLETPKEERK